MIGSYLLRIIEVVLTEKAWCWEKKTKIPGFGLLGG